MPTTIQELKARIMEILEERGPMQMDEFLFEVRQIAFSPRRIVEALAELEKDGILELDEDEVLHAHENSREAALV